MKLRTRLECLSAGANADELTPEEWSELAELCADKAALPDNGRCRAHRDDVYRSRCVLQLHPDGTEHVF